MPKENSQPQAAEQPVASAVPFAANASRNFTAWLARRQVSLAFTTYQVGKVFVVGVNDQQQLSMVERTFPRCMGLAVGGDGQTLWLSSVYQIWRLENFLDPGQLHDGYDRLYVPQASSVTGDIDVHDMAVDADGRLIFVNTLFSCLSRLSVDRSFEVVWKPPFISKLAAEDRCHLNGLAMENGRPRYVTAVSRSDVANGWRDRRVGGGVVIDLHNDTVVCDGLSMPHSPRLHRGRLYLHNSGTGEFGCVDPQTGTFTALTFCPGYLRGLAFVDHFAVVGLSKSRHDGAFADLPLTAQMTARDAEQRCGLMVIDLHSGDVVEWLTLDGVVSELYDVAVIPGARRPMLIGTRGDDICRMVRPASPLAPPDEIKDDRRHSG